MAKPEDKRDLWKGIPIKKVVRHACILESTQMFEKHFRPTQALWQLNPSFRVYHARMETHPEEKVETKQEVFQADGSTRFLFLLIDPHAAKDSRFQVSYGNYKQ